MVLAHPDLAHAGAPNYSSVIRNMLFFRIKVRHTTTNITNNSSNSYNHLTSSSIDSTVSSVHRFADWNEVVQQHVTDMWADLPVLRRELGSRELVHTMQLYVPHYETMS